MAGENIVSPRSTDSHVESAKVLDPKSNPIIEANTNKVIKNSPKLLNPDAIRAALIKDQKLKQENSPDFVLENVQNLWNEYLANHPSKSIKTALQHTSLVIEDKNILVYVPTSFIKDQIIQESKLIDEYRETFHIEGLAIQVIIARDKFPEYEDLSAIKIKRPKSEIYNAMLKKNAVLSDLIKAIHLKSDGD